MLFFEWKDFYSLWDKVNEELKGLKEALDKQHLSVAQEELGDLLFTLINVARWFEISLEEGLAGTNKRFLKRFSYVEEALEGDFSKQFLMKYPKRMFKEFGNNHNRFYRIKESIHRLEDDDLNYIAEKVSKIPESKRTLSSIFKHAVYKKPSLAIDVLKVFAGV